MPDKRAAAERRRDFREIYDRFTPERRGRAGVALRAVRRAVLPGPLPAAQQHPRLAAADRGGSARGGLRAVLGHQQHARDLRPDLPAGPAVRGQLRHRAVGPRHGHDRRGREATSPTPPSSAAGSSRVRPAARAGRSRSASSAPARPASPVAEELRKRGYQVARLRPLRPGRRPADLRHPRLQAGEGGGRAPRRRPARQRHPLPPRRRRRRRGRRLRRAARAPRRALHRHRRLPGARPRGARRAAWPASCRRSTILTASNRKGLGDAVAGVRRRHAERRRQARGRGRRRRHRHGLRAHRGPPGCHLGEVPLPARPRQHAGLDARGAPRRGGGRRVRLAVGTRGLPRRRPGRGRARASACAWVPPTPPAGRRPRSSRARASGSRPTWSSRRWASIPRTCRRCSASPSCKVSRWGTVGIDWDTMMTSLPGVFAGGDIVRGASLVVWGVRDGRDAAAGIHAYLAAGRRAPGPGPGLLRRTTAMDTSSESGRRVRRLRGATPRHLAAHGLYDPSLEHDACGVGCVVAIDGQPRREVVVKGIEALQGGLAPRRGRRRRQDRRRRRHPRPDPAGLLPAQDQGRRPHRPADRRRHGVPAAHQLPAAGGLPHHRRERGPGLRLQPSAAGARCRSTPRCWARRRPPPGPRSSRSSSATPRASTTTQFERDLYPDPPPDREAGAGRATSPTSTSARSRCRSVIYKGLFLAESSGRVLPRPEGRALRLRASRSSTSATRPTPCRPGGWPSRSAMLAHNGEINTLRGNVNWMKSHETRMVAAGLRRAQRGRQAAHPGRQLRQRRARCRVRGAGPRRPPAAAGQDPADPAGLVATGWRSRRSISDLFSYCNCVMEPWDGPAGARRHRFALGGGRHGPQRPAADALLAHAATACWCVGSETGMVPLDEPRSSRRAGSAPASIIAVDLRGRQLLPRPGAQGPTSPASSPTASGWRTSPISTSSWRGGRSRPPSYERAELRRRQALYGLTVEDMELILVADGARRQGGGGLDGRRHAARGALVAAIAACTTSSASSSARSPTRRSIRCANGG